MFAHIFHSNKIQAFSFLLNHSFPCFVRVWLRIRIEWKLAIETAFFHRWESGAWTNALKFAKIALPFFFTNIQITFVSILLLFSPRELQYRGKTSGGQLRTWLLMKSVV
jgi:hypothetical protein